jgi:ABC-type lipoprotein release transport system permease subunit
VHALTAVTRHRRRDLAILKTIGFTRRQLSRTVAWQSTVIVLVAIAVGVPLGLALGRWLWRFVSTQLGVVPHPLVPPVWVAVVVLGALVVANLIAALPGWRAARTPAAAVLRHE